MKRIKTFFIDDQSFDVNLQDAGPWVSYSLTAAGDNFEELCEDATVFEISQEGESVRDYLLKGAQIKVHAQALRVIEHYLDRRTRELIESSHDYATNRAINEAKEGY